MPGRLLRVSFSLMGTTFFLPGIIFELFLPTSFHTALRTPLGRLVAPFFKFLALLCGKRKSPAAIQTVKGFPIPGVRRGGIYGLVFEIICFFFQNINPFCDLGPLNRGRW
jgi:hypothetical protein